MSRNHSLITSSLALAAAALVSGAAHAELAPEARAKVAPSLARALELESARVDVLVYLTQQADLRAAELIESKAAKGRFVVDSLRKTAAATQAGVLAELTQESVSYRRFYVANVIAVEGASRALVEKLAARGDVAKLYADPAVRVVPAPTPAQLVDEPRESTRAVGDNIRRTGADRVWSEFGANGAGIVVAGADTGIEWAHPGLKAHYRGWDGSVASHDYNWHDAIRRPLTERANPCGYATPAPCDDNAHGTHTVGTMVGDDGRGNQVGMAPGATFIGCRNMDEGVGKPSTYLDCFEWFLAPYPRGGNPLTDGDPSKAPHVINNSWGCPTSEGCQGDEFLEAIRALSRAGVVVVAAAGNSGSSCSTIADAPAHHSDEVLVVGAVDHRSGAIASFSSRGPSAHDGKIGPDLSAPGVSVRSTIPRGGFSGTMWSGTSMAAPHVAGAVALLWSKSPEMVGDVAGTIRLLTSKSEPKTTSQSCGGTPGSQVPNNTFGHGIMNVYDAAR